MPDGTPAPEAITVTRRPAPERLAALGVSDWPIWSCGVSTFPWTYDERETCLLLEGEVTVTPEAGEPVRFGAGDLVEFPAGLSCPRGARCGETPGEAASPGHGRPARGFPPHQRGLPAAEPLRRCGRRIPRQTGWRQLQPSTETL